MSGLHVIGKQVPFVKEFERGNKRFLVQVCLLDSLLKALSVRHACS